MSTESLFALAGEIDELRAALATAQECIKELESGNARLHNESTNVMAEADELRDALATERAAHAATRATCDLLRADADKEWGASATERANLTQRAEAAESQRDALRVALEGVMRFVPVDIERLSQYGNEAITKARAVLADARPEVPRCPTCADAECGIHPTAEWSPALAAVPAPDAAPKQQDPGESRKLDGSWSRFATEEKT